MARDKDFGFHVFLALWCAVLAAGVALIAFGAQ